MRFKYKIIRFANVVETIHYFTAHNSREALQKINEANDYAFRRLPIVVGYVLVGPAPEGEEGQ